MESLRYLPYLKKDGWIVTNKVPLVNIPDYPEVESVLAEIEKVPNHVILDVETIAKEAGSARAANIVMLGAASPFLNISYEMIQDGIRSIFGRKGEEIVNMNLKALEAGRKMAEELKR